MECDNKWDKLILEAECQLNSAYNKTLGDTPFHVLFGYRLSFKDSTLHHLIAEDIWDDTEGLQNNIREKITVEQQQWKERYDSRYAKSVYIYIVYIYNVGDLVFIRKSPDVTGDSTKLQSKYRGPLVVTEVAFKDVYRVAGLKAENGRRYSTTVHVSHIKGYHLPETMTKRKRQQQKTRKKNDHRWKNLRERKLSRKWTMILENRDNQQGTVNHQCGMVATI
jgi:hypothetical protein